MGHVAYLNILIYVGGNIFFHALSSKSREGHVNSTATSAGGVIINANLTNVVIAPPQYIEDYFSPAKYKINEEFLY